MATQQKVIVGLRQLESWLKTKPPTSLAGQPGSFMACPVANYLTDRGVAKPSVEPRYIHFVDPTIPTYPKRRRRRLSRDVVRFIALVDGEPTKEVSVARALELIDTVRMGG